MNTFSLRVVASDKLFFEGRCKFIALPQEDGQKAIQVHHEDMMFAVVPGELRFQTDKDEWVFAAISSGFAQIINNRVTVLVLAAERPEEIDLIRAEEARARAEEELRQKRSQQEYYASQMSMARAMSRLYVGKREKRI